MASDSVETATLRIANLIADRRYADAVGACALSRLTETDIASVIDDYGRTFVRLPADFSNYLDVVLINGRPYPTWSVRVPLWSSEEGRSDLTLELTVAEQTDGPTVELDDLKVM